MTIYVFSDSAAFNIEKSSRDITIPELERLLKPGMPIMVERFLYHDLRDCSVTRALFVSDGALHEGHTFGVKPGAKHTIKAAIENPVEPNYRIDDMNGLDYYLVNGGSDKSAGIKVSELSLPDSSIRHENALSLQGLSVGQEVSRRGTIKIWLDKIVERHFPDSFRAIRFAQDAFMLTLHPSYVASASIRFCGNYCSMEDNKMMFNATRIMALSAAYHLISRAYKEVAGREGLVFSEIGNCLSQQFWQKWPVVTTDFEVYSLTGMREFLGFVKADHSQVPGTVYALPADKSVSNIFARAFSPENVMGYYPSKEALQHRERPENEKECLYNGGPGC